jgi:cardiolipin synthase
VWSLHYALLVSSFLLGALLVSQLLLERRAPGSTVAWLLVMALLPHVGVPLYLILGVRKIRKIKRVKGGLFRSIPYSRTPEDATHVERLLRAAGAPPRRGGNHVTVHADGESSYRALMELISGARRTLHVTTFILGTDAVGASILAALERRAREGVEVRLLLDGLGSFRVFPWKLRAFRQVGGRAAFFLPLLHIPFFGHTNLRNHRKLAVADGARAILGGMNLATEYMGPVPDPRRFRDLSVSVDGPAAADLEGVFLADWEFASHERLTQGVDAASAEGSGIDSELVASGPDVEGDPLYDAIVSGVFGASSRIWIATPYFIPDETLAKGLELAARRGVDVRVLVPRRSNHRLADLCRGSYLRQVARAGGKILFYDPGMMHAKAVVIDDAFALVGSANLDMRSLLLNFEVGLFLFGPDGTAPIASWFETLERSTAPARLKARRGSGLLDGLGRLLGPIL